MEAELLDSTERLMELEAQLNKLQKNLDNVLREKVLDQLKTTFLCLIVTFSDHRSFVILYLKVSL